MYGKRRNPSDSSILYHSFPRGRNAGGEIIALVQFRPLAIERQKQNALEEHAREGKEQGGYGIMDVETRHLTWWCRAYESPVASGGWVSDSEAGKTRRHVRPGTYKIRYLYFTL